MPDLSGGDITVSIRVDRNVSFGEPEVNFLPADSADEVRTTTTSAPEVEGMIIRAVDRYRQRHGLETPGVRVDFEIRIPVREIDTNARPHDLHDPGLLGVLAETFGSGQICWAVRRFRALPVESRDPAGTVIEGTPPETPPAAPPRLEVRHVFAGTSYAAALSDARLEWRSGWSTALDGLVRVPLAAVTPSSFSINSGSVDLVVRAINDLELNPERARVRAGVTDVHRPNGAIG